MKAKVYTIDGSIAEEIDLPSCFQVEFRPDIIQKAVNIIRANRRQPYGAKKTAGKDYVAESFGPGRGMARVPRLPRGRAAIVPQAVGGREAHPPKVEKIWRKRMNKKEMLLARLSALSATVNEEIVRQRGHKFSAELPIVIDDSFEELKKTKEVLEVFEKIGIKEDVDRAKEGKHIRAGKGKRKGRKYKIPKSVLIVALNKENIKKAASNLPGVDVVDPDELNVEYLAPGGHAGRLTVYTKQSVERLGEKYESI
ncbi:50S ribosomal protein L4 [Thermoplasmatales archaeon ex4484_30]|nr:MAG: 50S ribosomal protein L4 [Thermoplasmatales archaeon ex4484_30]